MSNYGIQLYSVRDITDKDLKGALKKVAELGYKYMEFAGFFGNSAEDVKSWLDEYGLTVTGTHTGLSALDNDFEGTVNYHKAIGCYDLIVPAAPINTKAEVDALVDKMNYYNEKLAKEGIRLHYHNHHREFMPNADGIIANEELLKRTNILFEIDTYWAYVAKRNPIEVLDQYGKRVKFIHLKDGNADGKGFSLGQGTAPVTAVLKKALIEGYGIIVESEGLDPTGIEEVGRCIDFLKKQ
jgi:sugar phosphate isomerase/epimerase